MGVFHGKVTCLELRRPRRPPSEVELRLRVQRLAHQADQMLVFKWLRKKGGFFQTWAVNSSAKENSLGLGIVVSNHREGLGAIDSRHVQINQDEIERRRSVE